MTELFTCTDCESLVFSYGRRPTPDVPICQVCQLLRELKSQMPPDRHAEIRASLLGLEDDPP